MKKKILIVEDNIALSQRLRDRLERCGYAVETAIDEPSARRLIRKSGFDLVLADVRLPKGDGLSLLEWLNGGHRHVPFVVMTGYANYPDAVRAVKSGADDYLPKPVDPERLLDTVRELLRPSLSLPQGGKTLFRLGSPAAREVERMATLVAPVEVSVLILGANGTGKESVARRIHEESDRRLMPFVAVNCSVISKELAPSLLFGLTRASVRSRVGFTLSAFNTERGMAKIQVIMALTLDGYLPPAGGQWMEWFRHDREGLPLWLSRCTFTLPPGYPLIDLMCELKSMSEGCTYVAEVTDAGQVELLRGLFLYRMVDELVVYLLPQLSGGGLSPLADLPRASAWTLRQSRSFGNGICRLVYRKKTE